MTKKLLKFVILIFIICNKALAHKEWIHQYIVQQAFYFLQNECAKFCINTKGLDEIKNNIFYPDGSPYHGYDEENPEDIFFTGYGIARGAWREDVDDPVYGYGSAGLFGELNGFTSSITHFWAADSGNDEKHTIPLSGEDNIPNAWIKARVYLFGEKEFTVFFKDLRWSDDDNKIVRGFIYKYNSLIDFYNTGQFYGMDMLMV